MKRIVSVMVILVAVAAGVFWWMQYGQTPSDVTTPVEDASTNQPTITPAEVVPTQAAETNEPIVPDVELQPKVVSAEAGLIQPGKRGGTLTLATLQGPQTFNPLLANSLASTTIISLMGAGLVEFNPVSKQIEPALAERWEWSDDFTRLTFHLRRGVQFSDGQPFSAEDVLFTYNGLIYNFDVQTGYRNALQVNGQPLRIEATDLHTVHITLPAPSRAMLNLFTATILPKHLLADSVALYNAGVAGRLAELRVLVDNERKALEFANVDDVEAIDWAINDLETATDEQNKATAQDAIDRMRQHHTALMNVEEPPLEVTQVLGFVDAYITILQGDVDRENWTGIEPGTFNSAWPVDTPPDQLAGLGPYRLASHDEGNQVVLERNPFYWKTDGEGTQLPYLEGVVFNIVGTLEAALMAFQNGESDAMLIRPQDWALLSEGIDSDNDCGGEINRLVCAHPDNDYALLRGGPIYDSVFVTFNQDALDPIMRAVFRSTEFRQAVAHAVDKQTIIDDVYGGLGAPQWGPINPLTPIYDDEATRKYPYDLDEAARILDEIGLVDLDGDGVRNITNEFLSNAGVDAATLPDSQRNEQFRELEFVYKTFTGSPVIEQSSIVILNDLETLGFDISFQPVDFNTLINNLFTGQFEAAMMGFAVGLDPVENANTWRSDGNLHFWHPSAFDVPYQWEAQIDDILNNLNTTFDPEDRQALYSAFQRIMSENLPLIYTVNNRFLYAYNSHLRNTDAFEPLLGGFPTILAFSDILWLED